MLRLWEFLYIRYQISSSIYAFNLLLFQIPFFIANSIIIYPNPASTNLFVDYGILEDINANFLLFDMSGRLIRNVVMNKQNSQMRIDLDGISNGLYLIKILDQNGQIIKTDRVIVQK